MILQGFLVAIWSACNGYVIACAAWSGNTPMVAGTQGEAALVVCVVAAAFLMSYSQVWPYA